MSSRPPARLARLGVRPGLGDEEGTCCDPCEIGAEQVLGRVLPDLTRQIEAWRATSTQRKDPASDIERLVLDRVLDLLATGGSDG